MSTENCLQAVLTGIRAPEKMSRKNRGWQSPEGVDCGDEVVEKSPDTKEAVSTIVGFAGWLKLELGTCNSLVGTGKRPGSGQCGELLCLEAGWAPPHGSPLLFGIGQTWAYLQDLPLRHLPVLKRMQMPLPSTVLRAQPS